MHGAEDSAAEFESEETVDRIAAALASLGHQVIHFPFRSDLVVRLQSERPDIVFNIAEGWNGRNRESLVPAILEFLGLPYTGSDPLTLGVALDKALCKAVVSAAGVPVVPSWVVRSSAELASTPVEFPAFVKPNCEGSSKGIRFSSRVTTPQQLQERVSWIVQTYGQPALVEPFLAGREFTIGLLGNEEPETLPIMEVLPGASLAAALSDGEAFVYSFEAKSRNLETFRCPAPVPDETAALLRHIAISAFKALGCRDVGRVDIRMDAAGQPYFLEINPLPGLSRESLLPLQAAAAGLSFESLVERILQSALQRYGLEATRSQAVGNGSARPARDGKRTA